MERVNFVRKICEFFVNRATAHAGTATRARVLDRWTAGQKSVGLHPEGTSTGQ
jgi:hypothetical protein